MINISITCDGDGADPSLEWIEFPGGELHPRLGYLDWPETVTTVTVRADIRNSNDMMALLLLRDALERLFYNAKTFDLVMPYFPYARQDRVAVRGEALGAAVAAKLVNSMNWTSVEIWDAHSDVVTALVNRIRHIEQHTFVSSVIAEHYATSPKPILVCPDNGARKKVQAIAKTCGIKDIIYADKKRDVLTGKITGTQVHIPHDMEPRILKDLLIVDDICDGGRTFVELAKELISCGVNADHIELYVTHGIFSKGLEVFDDLIDRIYCPNIFPKEYRIVDGQSAADIGKTILIQTF